MELPRAFSAGRPTASPRVTLHGQLQKLTSGVFCMQGCVKGGGREGSALGGDAVIRDDVVWPERGLQPAEQDHLQLLPLPLHRQRCPRGGRPRLLLSDVPSRRQEGLLRPGTAPTPPACIGHSCSALAILLAHSYWIPTSLCASHHVQLLHSLMHAQQVSLDGSKANACSKAPSWNEGVLLKEWSGVCICRRSPRANSSRSSAPRRCTRWATLRPTCPLPRWLSR